ncbi:GNAT family N-acetyltransferase [Anoxybacillus sp. UARK-01]|uniref:GNAT family N-acetyltransferase n=1 Tax=Anoxybacillus sp. UARK-01 TaxID=1895648 RepID=UPI0009B9CB49|nr:GNAT family N-acetyltransferase [Anoxybacillus sp. UARK-01]OQM44244.1 GNAT family N-acetyltransferase [Anoxybacillus sp. UARK-01]
MKITQTTDYKTIAALNKHVHDLHVALYPRHFKKYDAEAMKRFFQSVIHQPHFIFLLLEENEQACGYAWLEIRTHPENIFFQSYQSIYVHQISISESVRNKGYGTQLMEYIYELAQDKGIYLIELDYWSKNEVAKNFYAKQGFQVYRELVYKELAPPQLSEDRA